MIPSDSKYNQDLIGNNVINFKELLNMTTQKLIREQGQEFYDEVMTVYKKMKSQ